MAETPQQPAIPNREGSKDFPRLPVSEIGRLRAYGVARKVREQEILFEQGDSNVSFFVVLSGHMEIVQPSESGERIIATHDAGEFTGEMTMLSNRRSLVRGRMTTAGELIEIPLEKLRELIQTEPDLSEIILRAFILRRLLLIQHGFGDVVLLGSRHSANTLHVREFLSRNGHPFTYLDLDRDPESQSMLERFNVTIDDVPVLICRGKSILKNPTNQQIAECLGYNAELSATQVHDLVVLGAGPAGLAAAVYGASEGLDVVVLESNAPGGQAGSSSKIENYLGFPMGISGQELSRRAYTQAQKFGADIMVARTASGLKCERKPYVIELDGSGTISARTVILATGAAYKKLALENLAAYEGKGIYYGATFMEAQLCGDSEVVVVGGGNSAGQAAVFLSQTAKKVYMLVRGHGLSETMSRYLIRRIEDSPHIELLTQTEITGLDGDDHLGRIRWKKRDTGDESWHDIEHLFLMTGASPNTSWLQGCVVLDDRGFVKTGRDLNALELKNANWPLPRSPYLLETSMPGVFAVGDVRSGNVKRVASAVGEGSIAVHMVHQVLAE